MRIYTRTGDRGETSLYGGRRVLKDDPRIEAYGTVDELNSVLGIIRSMKIRPSVDRILERIQNDLFVIGADLATPISRRRKCPSVSRIEEKHVKALETTIDRLEAELPRLKHFILPAGSSASAYLHFARAVCRRAERLVVRLSRTEKVSPIALVYLNRLSDLLFVLARWNNQKARARETRWGGVLRARG